MSYQAIFRELFPDQPCPGDAAGFITMLIEEVRSLRLLTETMADSIATATVDERAHRPLDEIQRAHDLVGQYCHEFNDRQSFEHVSALCWVLRHDHNTVFAQILEAVEGRLRHLGITVVRLPDLVDPGKENITDEG